MPQEKSYHMTPDEFRRYGRAVVDWIADYYEQVESLPVLSRVQPGQIRASLPAEPPLQGQDFEAILDDVGKLILPGLTHWQSPNFFAFFPAGLVLYWATNAGLSLAQQYYITRKIAAAD